MVFSELLFIQSAGIALKRKFDTEAKVKGSPRTCFSRDHPGTDVSTRKFQSKTPSKLCSMALAE